MILVSLFFSLFLLQVTAGAAESPVVFTKFCAPCSLAVESFVSYSGQFVVHGSLQRPGQAGFGSSDDGTIELEPQLVAVTGERLRKAFCEELRVDDSFADKVHVLLLDRANPGNPVKLVSNVYPDGFFYQMGIPARVDEMNFIRAMVQVILLEHANQRAPRKAEIPRWLVNGMTHRILSSVQPTYVANRKPITIERRGYDRLAATRTLLKTNACLSFHELSFPGTAPAGTAEEVYDSSAHLFVHSLLALPDGPALMNTFLRSLPLALNWQTAFYHVYREHFTRALDVEKWWALTWFNFKSHDKAETWPVAMSLAKLEATLLTSMEVRTSTNTLPSLRDVRLQELVQEAGFSVQSEVIQLKLQQLYFLSFNLAPEPHRIASEYQSLLRSYVDRRVALPVQPGLRADPEAKLQALVKSTVRRLDELDRARVNAASSLTTRLQ